MPEFKIRQYVSGSYYVELVEGRKTILKTVAFSSRDKKQAMRDANVKIEAIKNAVFKAGSRLL